MVLEELRAMKPMTGSKKKITLPGPYLVTRSIWLKGLCDNYYNFKE